MTKKNYNFIQNIIPQVLTVTDILDTVHFDKVLVITDTKNILFTFSNTSNHLGLQFKQLACFSGIEYSRRDYAFGLVYDVLTVIYNVRYRFKTFFHELTKINTLIKVYKSCSWWEREAWELYGIGIAYNSDLRRLLTDYGFEGYPMRKEFSCFGYHEIEYDRYERRLTYKETALSQEGRVFKVNSIF